uniref:Major sperm protein n=1 Tax=Elaeophora elaphi TaxID=1147741 RepID=A0A0R3S5Q5_9BILA
MINAAENFYHSNVFITLSLLTIIHILSGNYSLILCNVLCTLPPGIVTYFQMANKIATIKACFFFAFTFYSASNRSVILYWLVCALSFASDTIYASVSGYSYLKTMTLMLLFHYCTMGNVNENKCVLFNRTLSGDARHLNELKKHAREWIANKQLRHRRTSEDTTSETVDDSETILDSLHTVPKENCTIVGFSTVKLNSTRAATAITATYSSRTVKRSGVIGDERSENVEGSLTLATSTAKMFDENHELIDCSRNQANSIGGLVSFPESQVRIRAGRFGPVTLAFTNNYKQPVIWALKTNALKRLVAFPTTGTIPPTETVQIKIDLIGQMPKKNSKDRLSLEYFVIDGKIEGDGNCYNFFHYNESNRMKKCLEVIYVQH